MLGAYGLFWMIGLLATLYTHPHLVGPSGLRIRNSTTVDVAVRWDEVDAVRVRRRSLPPGGQTQVDDVANERVLSLGVGSQTSVDLLLSRPLTVAVKKTGGAPVTQIRFHVDDPEGLAAAAQTHLSLTKTSPRTPRPDGELRAGRTRRPAHRSEPCRCAAAPSRRRPAGRPPGTTDLQQLVVVHPRVAADGRAAEPDVEELAFVTVRVGHRVQRDTRQAVDPNLTADSSRTSRTIASAGCSPGSTMPASSDHSRVSLRRPRSIRPASSRTTALTLGTINIARPTWRRRSRRYGGIGMNRTLARRHESPRSWSCGCPFAA
jgi:hypothetical protein